MKVGLARKYFTKDSIKDRLFADADIDDENNSTSQKNLQGLINLAYKSTTARYRPAYTSIIKPKIFPILNETNGRQREVIFQRLVSVFT
jgi:hypothetical protein